MTNGLDPAIAWTLRLSLALLFGAAARHKLADFGAFRRTLADYDILAAGLVPAVAAGVIAVEAFLAAGFLVPGIVFVPTAALLLLALYTGAIGWNLARGRRDIDCGCLGPGHHKPLTPWLVVRNGIVAAGAVVVLAGSAPRPWVWIDGITLGGGVTTITLLWIASNALAAETMNRTGRIT